MNTDIESLLVDDTPGAANGERKRLHAARLNSMHLRQPVGQKRILQLAYEEIERLLDIAKEQGREIGHLESECTDLWQRVEEVERTGFLRRLWRRFF